MHNFAESRHSAYRSVLGAAAGDTDVLWHSEPVVIGHRRLSAKHLVKGIDVAVPISASVAVAPGVGVISASDNGWIRMWSPSLDKLYWERRLDNSIYASLVVDHATESVICVSTSGLACRFTLRGELMWAQPLGQAVLATPVVDSSKRVIHVATFGSMCVGLNVETGALIYRVKTPPPWFASSGIAAHRDVYASPVVTPDSLLVLAGGEHVVGIASDGQNKWSVDLGASIKSSPVLVADGEFAAAFAVDGSCALIDTSSGQVVRQNSLPGRIAASAATSAGRVVVGVQGGSTYCLNDRTLEVEWVFGRAPRSYTSFFAAPQSTFVFLDDGGDAVGLRARDGRFVWQTSQVLGLPDHEPAMDVTPIVSSDGLMYGASYHGDLYAFMFRRRGEMIDG